MTAFDGGEPISVEKLDGDEPEVEITDLVQKTMQSRLIGYFTENFCHPARFFDQRQTGEIGKPTFIDQTLDRDLIARRFHSLNSVDKPGRVSAAKRCIRGLYDAQLAGAGNGLGTALHAKLAIYVMGMLFHRAGCQKQLISDFLV